VKTPRYETRLRKIADERRRHQLDELARAETRVLGRARRRQQTLLRLIDAASSSKSRT
jgi:hypothetical protein